MGSNPTCWPSTRLPYWLGPFLAVGLGANACAVGRVLRYVAEYQGQWVGLLVFSSAAFHIKLRDQWLRWSPQQVEERRHLIAQNARFLILASPRRWPNLAARVLKLTCQRLPQDWLDQFGYPVVLTFPATGDSESERHR